MKLINMAGLKFGRLTVVSLQKMTKYGAHRKVLCDCGKSKIVLGVSLRKSHPTQSCGCLRLERMKVPAGSHRLKMKDEKKRTAICSVCGPTNIVKTGHGGFSCKIAVKERRSKLYRKERPIGKFCECCGKSNNLCWDHDHETGQQRGTLCRNCNAAFGLLDENIELVLKLYEYLKKR